MALKMRTLKNREQWLEHRKKYIGGSDASAIIGANHWMSNVQLWRLKTGREEQADISDNPAVKYGTEAEPHIRELFKLDHPEYEVYYKENNTWTDLKRFPFAAASLDGWTVEKETGRQGILEIKTSSPRTATAIAQWDNRIPDNYYVQQLHYLMVTGWDYVDLRALLRLPKGTEIRDYHFERSEIEKDIEFLYEKEKKFYEFIKKDIQPNLILQEI